MPSLKTFVEDLLDTMEVDGVGTPGADMFASLQASVPAAGTNLIVVQTSGTNPERTHNAVLTPAYINPAAQITVRAATFQLAMTKAQAAYNSLFKIRNQFINSGWYLWIKPLQEPGELGIDERGQVRVGFNVIARKRP